MATGLEMYDALRRVLAAATDDSVAVNTFDAEDLMKLTADDLCARGVDAEAAVRIDSDLAQGRLVELGRSLGIALDIDGKQPNLIAGEGIRRSAGALADDDQSLEQMFEELDSIRHPERHRV